MNTPNFTMMQLTAQERRQAILRQAQQDQLLAVLKSKAGNRHTLHGGVPWLQNVLRLLHGTVRKSFEKRAVVRSGSVS